MLAKGTGKILLNGLSISYCHPFIYGSHRHYTRLNYFIIWLAVDREAASREPNAVSEGLYALSCGPDLRVMTCVACSVNGVRYSTFGPEKNLKTPNSGVMAKGTHRGNTIEFYGVLKEVIELQYNSSLQIHLSVVLFRCDWCNQEGKCAGIRDDTHFKSIKIQSCWY